MAAQGTALALNEGDGPQPQELHKIDGPLSPIWSPWI